LGERTPCKNQLISIADKVIYFKGTIFLRSTKPLFTSQNRVGTSKKNSPIFFNMRLPDLRFPWEKLAISVLTYAMALRAA
jgi:hypothetical protein